MALISEIHRILQSLGKEEVPSISTGDVYSWSSNNGRGVGKIRLLYLHLQYTGEGSSNSTCLLFTCFSGPKSFKNLWFLWMKWFFHFCGFIFMKKNVTLIWNLWLYQEIIDKMYMLILKKLGLIMMIIYVFYVLLFFSMN